MAETNYSLTADGTVKRIPAPSFDYRPPMPKRPPPGIGLVGCGGISSHHLAAYRTAGWDVLAFCDIQESAAVARRDAYYPRAAVYTSLDDLLAHPGIGVIDLATHPSVRAGQFARVCEAGLHVLSQKPLASTLAQAEYLSSLAENANIRAAVNQNGRWAPYFAWMQAAVRSGMIGEVNSVAMTLNWDHSWTQGTAFENIPHLMLYDFGIHWFDQMAEFFRGQTPVEIFATTARSSRQTMQPPLLATATVRYPHGLGVLHLNGHSSFGSEETIVVCGSVGTLRSRGEPCGAHLVELHTAEGVAIPALEGAWFDDGFRGAMGELLVAIEENREPQNSVRNNLHSLQLCFAALESADHGKPIRM